MRHALLVIMGIVAFWVIEGEVFSGVQEWIDRSFSQRWYRRPLKWVLYLVLFCGFFAAWIWLSANVWKFDDWLW